MTFEPTERRVELARQFLELVGYDPFVDDPNIDHDEVEKILAEVREMEREAAACFARLR